MKKLKTLLVCFQNRLSLNQVPAFRGGIIEKVGRENLLFHQHKSDKELLYMYPLIQYKSIAGKSSIVCLGDGVDELHKLFEFKSWDILLQGQKYSLQIDRLNLNTITLNIWNQTFTYSIKNWIALNSANYERYVVTDSLIERIEMLEKSMTGNILSFAKGVDWRIEQPVTVRISEIQHQRVIKFKGIPLIAFDLEFKTNVFLPNFIGLGKSASHGYGIIKMNSKSV